MRQSHAEASLCRAGRRVGRNARLLQPPTAEQAWRAASVAGVARVSCSVRVWCAAKLTRLVSSGRDDPGDLILAEDDLLRKNVHSHAHNRRGRRRRPAEPQRGAQKDWQEEPLAHSSSGSIEQQSECETTECSPNCRHFIIFNTVAVRSTRRALRRRLGPARRCRTSCCCHHRRHRSQDANANRHSRRSCRPAHRTEHVAAAVHSSLATKWRLSALDCSVQTNRATGRCHKQ